MSDQHLDADRLYFTRNAADAIAAGLGIVLDQDGRTVTPPEGAILVDAVAHLLYARHTRDRLGSWDELTDEDRDWWADIAVSAALIDVPPVPVIAARLYAALERRHGRWDSLTQGDRARWTITAQHVARLIAEAGSAPAARGTLTVPDPTGHEVDGVAEAEAELRERIAQDIEAATPTREDLGEGGLTLGAREGMIRAARIARGGAR